ncbi:hypothetical protein [Kutzneria sp. NPDC052558]|uniref:hypothetical protein n=1 Tax=Kutzneria sp. NPDC052558 TaxID=3364121 RepID=UPI0037CB316F
MSEPTPSVPVVRLPSRRTVAGVVLLLTGLLAIGGTFAAIYTITMAFPLGLTPLTRTFVVTSWVSDYPTYGSVFGPTSHTNYFGVPALVAGALALYGADLLLRRRAVAPRQVAQVRLFAVAATGLIAGYAWLSATNLLDTIASSGDSSVFSFTPGAGLWLFVAAALLGALSFVLMLGLEPEAPGPVPATAVEEEVVVYQVDVDTPPMGFEVPVNLPPTDTYQPPEKPQAT